MRALYISGGPLRRQLQAQSCKIFKRTAFGRPAATASRSKPSWELPSTPARTRFAPSPTGYLHLGSLRTALYNYLLAKATGGQFVLRLEDTDQTRIVGDSERRLYEELHWAGLDWDEGPDIGGPFGPYKQSMRLSTYKQHVDMLIAEDKAYRCFCSHEALEEMKAKAWEAGSKVSYNGTCSHIPPDVSARRAANGEPHVIRLRSAESSTFTDLVYGNQSKETKEDDFVLIKRDGYPTYHFANVVDDHLMEITHVIRGAEWLVSTSGHAMLYKAFGWQPPTFAHVGLLVDQHNQKLSKRRNDIGIDYYMRQNTDPVALLNYVVLHGWSPGRGTKGETSEVMTLQEMIDKFHLKFTKGNIHISNKLDYLSHKHTQRFAKTVTRDIFTSKVMPYIEIWAKRLDSERDGVKMGIPAMEPQYQGVKYLGPLVLPARATKEIKFLDEEYVWNLFELDKSSFTTAERFVLRNMYVLWKVADKAYIEAYEKTQLNFRGLWKRRPRKESDNPSWLVFQNLDQGEFVYEKSRPSHFVLMFESVLREIPVEDWNQHTLAEKLTPVRKDMYWKTTKGPGPLEECGLHWLRWIVTAKHAGPPLIPSMAFLGKDEVMWRVKTAKEVAIRLQGALDLSSPTEINTDNRP